MEEFIKGLRSEGSFTTTLQAADDSLERLFNVFDDTRTFSVVHLDGTVDRGTVKLTNVDTKGDNIEASFIPSDDWRRERPSTAALRRELRAKTTARARKTRIYQWLLYRQRHT